MSLFLTLDIETARGFPQYQCTNCGWQYSTDVPNYKAVSKCPKCQGDPHLLDWRDYIPLGLSCAATTLGDTTSGPDHWVTRAWTESDGGQQVHYDEFELLLIYLEKAQERGIVCVTWNGVSFDLPFLADAYPQWKDRIKGLARGHCDPAYQMFCERGYMIALSKAAAGLGVSGKTEGMRGDLAPLLWTGIPEWQMSESQKHLLAETGLEPGLMAAREHVIEYVQQDAIATALVYAALARGESCAWVTARGTVTKKPWTAKRQDDRLLTVRESKALAKPKGWPGFTPKPRAKYDGWLTG